MEPRAQLPRTLEKAGIIAADRQDRTVTEIKTDAPAQTAATFTTQTLPEVLEMLKLRMSARLAEQQAMSAIAREQKAAREMARDVLRAQAAQMSEFLEMARQGVQGLPEPYRSEAVQVLAKLEMEVGGGSLARFEALLDSYAPSPDH